MDYLTLSEHVPQHHIKRGLCVALLKKRLSERIKLFFFLQNVLQLKRLSASQCTTCFPSEHWTSPRYKDRTPRWVVHYLLNNRCPFLQHSQPLGAFLGWVNSRRPAGRLQIVRRICLMLCFIIIASYTLSQTPLTSNINCYFFLNLIIVHAIWQLLQFRIAFD